MNSGDIKIMPSPFPPIIPQERIWEKPINPNIAAEINLLLNIKKEHP